MDLCTGFAQDMGAMSSKVLKHAFSATEDEFLCLVDKNWQVKPKMASVGSCCLVGVLSGDHLYVANLGDSRVVLGTKKQGRMVAVRLSDEHNAGNAEVRQELKEQHPDDSHIVVFKHGVWRVKGIIQVSIAFLVNVTSAR
jgi:pyruvate dehydrogenase phosphatase